MQENHEEEPWICHSLTTYHHKGLKEDNEGVTELQSIAYHLLKHLQHCKPAGWGKHVLESHFNLVRPRKILFAIN